MTTAQMDVSGELPSLTQGPKTSNRFVRMIRMWVLPLGTLAVVWEGISHFSGLNPQLFPPIEKVAVTFWQMLLDGVLLQNTLDTLGRMLLGWAVASVVGVLLGFAMATVRIVNDLLGPMISILLPIPSLAWIPLFVLWFGLGNTSVVVLVAFSAALPMILNTYSGMRSVSPVLLRAAQSMNITGVRLLRQVVLPGALPSVMTGLRIGLAQAWRAVVAGEMIAGSAMGLGVLIFNSRQFLQTDVMLAALLVIGPLGLLLETTLFQTIERLTIEKWGMAASA